MGYTPMVMGIDLAGKVIAITGASSGIGAATAVACARAGMDVVIGARRMDRLKDVAAQIIQIGRKAIAMPCDVDRDDDVQKFIERPKTQWGRLDAVFANAGVGLCKSITDTSDTQMRSIFETNYFGTLRVIRSAAPLMKEQGHGHILICSSAASEIGMPMYGAYCATKAAQDSIAGALRAELADEGVHVSSVHPIGTRTEFSDVTAVRSGHTHQSFNTPPAMVQDAPVVARSIVHCLRRPRPEVWPHWPSRLGLAIVTAFPPLGANTMRRIMRRRFAKHVNGIHTA